MKENIRIWIYSAMILGVFLMLTSNCKKGDDSNGVVNDPTPSATVTDIVSNVYHSVKIGTQTWMVENLKTSKYRNGDQIPNVTDATAWAALNTGAYCWYDNDAVTNKATYGALYNWYAVDDSRNIAPTGWHVPTDAEWTTLTTYLGGKSVAGGKLKETRTTHWLSPNTGATNEVGFTALPGGMRNNELGFKFVDIGKNGYWWSSSKFVNDFNNGADLFIFFDGSYVEPGGSLRNQGYSVRCVKDSW